MLLGPCSLRFSSAQQTSDGLLSHHGNGRKPSPLFLQSLCAWQGIKRAVVPQPLLVPPLVPPLATTLDNTGQRWTDQRYVAKKTLLLLLTPPLRALFSNLAPLHSSRFLLIRLLIRFIHPLIPAISPPCVGHPQQRDASRSKDASLSPRLPFPRDTCFSYVSCGSVLFVYYPKRK
jgi:hypothetical protein